MKTLFRKCAIKSWQQFNQVSNLIHLPIATHCQVCGQFKTQPICQLCFQLLPWLPIHCHFCFKPIANGKICGQCLKKSKNYHDAFVCFHYASPISDFIQQLKYQSRLDCAPLLSKFLSHVILSNIEDLQNRPNAIIPIPLHVKRLRQRGFNQSAQLARYLSQDLDIPLILNAMQRIKFTTPQVGLSETQRRQNLKNAFAVNDTQPALKKYNSILLLDDVITSGSTINSAAASLANVYHGKIIIAAIAKTKF